MHVLTLTQVLLWLCCCYIFDKAETAEDIAEHAAMCKTFKALQLIHPSPKIRALAYV